MAFTNQEKREAAQRELAMRERVYPRWIADNRMSKAKADREIALMREIVSDYQSLEAGDRLI